MSSANNKYYTLCPNLKPLCGTNNNYYRSYDHLHSVQDVMKISDVIEKVVDWNGLAGWLGIDAKKITEDCKNEPVQCYRRTLVRIYCDRTAKSPQQVAEDMARVLEDEMENRIVAKKLRQLIFGEL